MEEFRSRSVTIVIWYQVGPSLCHYRKRSAPCSAKSPHVLLQLTFLFSIRQMLTRYGSTSSSPLFPTFSFPSALILSAIWVSHLHPSSTPGSHPRATGNSRPSLSFASSTLTKGFYTRLGAGSPSLSSMQNASSSMKNYISKGAVWTCKTKGVPLPGLLFRPLQPAPCQSMTRLPHRINAHITQLVPLPRSMTLARKYSS